METLRAFLKKHEKTSGIVAGLAVVIVVAVALTQMMGSSRAPEIGSGYYLTTDDGVSYINGSADDVPPVMIGGKAAVCAHLGKEQTSRETKVFYMHQFTPEAQAAVKKMKAGQPLDAKESEAMARGRLFKKPGDKEWRTFQSVGEQEGWVRGIKGSDGKTPNELN